MIKEVLISGFGGQGSLLAEKLGSGKVVNMIILGAYLGAEDPLPMDKVEEALREEFGPGKEKIIPLNRRALEEGAALAKQPME